MAGGFWVRFWMESGRGHPHLQETYKFYPTGPEHSSWDESDKSNSQLWQGEAERWAQNEMGGWAKDSYRYGYELVEHPPKEWLDKELKASESRLEILRQKKEMLAALIEQIEELERSLERGSNT